jgi:hypothetical protein
VNYFPKISGNISDLLTLRQRASSPLIHPRLRRAFSAAKARNYAASTPRPADHLSQAHLRGTNILLLLSFSSPERRTPMPEIHPKVTRAKLRRSARKTTEGKGRASLPGVRTDAKHVNATDKCGYDANRELATLIQKAVRSVKKSDKGGQHFVLGWRLYPNKAHSRWKGKDVHSCGCGCGCSA